MTNDEIIALATEAGLCTTSNGFVDWIDAGPSLHEMTAFAKLVSAKERENWPAEMKAMENQVNILTDALGEAVFIYSEAVEKEREACAKVADEWSVGYPHPSKIIAEAIRARGEA